jgi:hypothetical protein
MQNLNTNVFIKSSPALMYVCLNKPSQRLESFFTLLPPYPHPDGVPDPFAEECSVQCEALFKQTQSNIIRRSPSISSYLWHTRLPGALLTVHNIARFSIPSTTIPATTSTVQHD